METSTGKILHLWQARVGREIVRYGIDRYISLSPIASRMVLSQGHHIERVTYLLPVIKYSLVNLLLCFILRTSFPLKLPNKENQLRKQRKITAASSQITSSGNN
jgi:hypothetical protein